MTRKELEAALEWADGVIRETNIEETYDNLSALASALREAWEEVDRLAADKPNYGGWIEYLGVGSYKLHVDPPVNLLPNKAKGEKHGET